MFKNFLPVALCVCLMPFIFGCSGSAAPASGKADVTVWHWMTDRQAAFDTLTEEYFKQTGVRVVFETYAPEDAYKSKITAAASGKLLPDIYSPQGDKRELASYINAGFIADLTDEMNKGWKDTFFTKALSQSTFEEGNQWNVKPGIYGVPLDVNSIMLYYNKDLFTKAGLDPEKPIATWAEFMEAGKALRAAGIQPFVSGFGEGWLIGAFAASYQWNMLGKQGVLDMIEGKIPYTDPRYVKVLSLFEEMRNNKMFASGIVTMVNKDAERTFATERAAMSLNGSWGVNVYNAMNPALNYSVMPLPKIADAPYPVLMFGGEGSPLFVNGMSPKKQEAIAFLKWLTADAQQRFLANETLNIPSNKNVANDLPPVLKIFSENINNTMDSLPKVEAWQVTNFVNINLQAIVIGERNAAEAAREIQGEKDRQNKAA